MFAFLDMDGVIADFVGGVCAAHGKSSPYEDLNNHGVWDMESLWGMSAREFWAPCNNNPEFWDSLSKTHDADLIVETVVSRFGVDNVAILTSPSMDPQCVPGKRRWIRRRYPYLEKQMLFGSAKHFLAGPKRVLIDDRSKNIDDFEKAGGSVVCVPRLWNDLHPLAAQAADYVKMSLSRV